MEPREATKDVTIKGKVYQINKLDSRTGCWLFAVMSEKSGAGEILSGLGKMSRKEFDEIQTLVLKQVFHLDNSNGNTFPIAVIMPTGSFIGDLVEDTELAFRLTSESIIFNLKPFLVVAGSTSQT